MFIQKGKSSGTAESSYGSHDNTSIVKQSRKSPGIKVTSGNTNTTKLSVLYLFQTEYQTIFRKADTLRGLMPSHQILMADILLLDDQASLEDSYEIFNLGD